MQDESTFWFPVKRYGWGWGLPVRWQGWVVLALYIGLMFGGARFFFKPRGDAAGLAVYLVVLTVVFIVTVIAKGERPVRWRWGSQ